MSTAFYPPSGRISRVTVGDGYGQMLVDAFAAGPRRGSHRQVIERSDGYVSVEDAYRYFSHYEEWVEAEQVAMTKLRGRILDVGCAAGRHMLEARQRGHTDIIGIDPSAGAVDVACAQGLDVRLGSVQEPGDDLGTFDTILLLGGNLGLLGSLDTASAVLRSLARVARPGAQILANGHDPYTQAEEHSSYHAENRRAGRLPGQVLMRVRYGSLASDWFGRLMLSATELHTLLESSPWKLRSAGSYGPTGFYLAHLELRDETPDQDGSPELPA
ncbi:methyltransferase family protein [Actinocorallia herbida]|uniref:Methyltransferase family protein n=1 Tax=Actinocorallia herbida TaxID=58109 RepID=A0A3N1CML0_9ACTN|nr:class I SAM-dependent methyltransferase [Actinocorallia herbida]ROO82549.1 methyltransferase family protein [Actinocorallia herbida]